MGRLLLEVSVVRASLRFRHVAMVLFVVLALSGLVVAGLSTLEPARIAHTAASPQRPSATLAAAVEATVRGRPQEMRLFYAAAAPGDRFYQLWAGRLPAGNVTVAQADEVDAGAEHGHLVPVTLWVDNRREVAGLQGEARWIRGESGYRIDSLRLARMPLQVSSWADAARRVSAVLTKPGMPVLQPDEAPRPVSAPFHGRFEFLSAQGRYAVDAQTGEVVSE
jgi:hypothetical protein